MGGAKRSTRSTRSRTPLLYTTTILSRIRTTIRQILYENLVCCRQFSSLLVHLKVKFNYFFSHNVKILKWFNFNIRLI